MTLALGLGAMTTIASAVRPILLEPVAYPDAARVAIIWEIDSTGRRIDGTFGMYRWLVERSRAFASIAVTRPWLATITGVDEPERIHAASVTAGYFDVLANSIYIMQDQITRARLAAEKPAVVLLPRLGNIGLLEFNRAKEAIAEGRACVERSLNEIGAAVG